MPKNVNPAERSLRARLAAHRLHSQYDSRELTKAARAAFEDRFLKQVDPDNVLPDDERRKRAKHALKAHMLELSRLSAKARRAKGR